MRFVFSLLACLTISACVLEQKSKDPIGSINEHLAEYIGTANIYHNSEPKTIKLVKTIGRFPNWSSDGKNLIFAMGSDIFLFNIESRMMKRIGRNLLGDYDLFLGGLSLSPDDSKIAFVKSTKQKDSLTRIYDIYVLYIKNWNFWEIQKLTENQGNNVSPTWTPNKNIVFASDRDGYSQIYVMSETGKILSKLTNIVSSKPSDNIKPSFAKDGKKIAFVSLRDGNAEIYVMDPNGENQRNISNNPAMDLDPNWSPDSKKIVFSSDRNGNFDLYVMDIDGSNTEKLTESTDNELHPSWSPTGDRIAFSSVRMPSVWREHSNGKIR